VAATGLAFVVLLLGAPAAASPAAPSPSAPGAFSHLTVEDGLPHSYVRSIIEDRDGFMWFATARGVVRYDGARLVVYRHDPADAESLPAGEPSCLLEDREGRLWVGTMSSDRAGVAVLDRATGRFARHLADGRPGSLSAPYVQAIYEDREGRLWVGHARGVDLYDPGTRAFTAFPIGPPGSEPRVMAMIEDSLGRFWVATERRGLFQLDRATGTWRSFAVRAGRADGDASDLFFAAFLEQPAGTLWVAGYGGGLVRVELASGATKRYRPEPGRADSLSVAQVVALAGDGDRLVYVGTENGGLDVLDTRTERFAHHRPVPGDPRSIGSPSIWALFRDRQGIVWAGANGFGVSWLSPLTQRFEAVRAGRGGLGDPRVTSIAEGPDGRIWLGTDGGGLHVMDPRTGEVRPFPLPQNGTRPAANAVQSVLADADDRVFVGFWSTGLCLVDTRSGRVRFFHPPPGRRSAMSDNIWRVLDAGGGELLVATNDGAFLFDPRRESFVPLADRVPGAGLGQVSDAAVDAAGGLWLASPTSVEHVDRRAGTVKRFEGESAAGVAFAGSFVDALHVDTRGHLWIGTERGLTCLDPAGRRLATYGEGDGLPNPNVVSITEDASGSVWAGTYGGLVRLSGAVNSPAGAAVLAFDERDGVTSRISVRGAAFRSRQGELYFGTSRGLTRFRPEGFETNTRVPPVVLTGLRTGPRPAGPGAPRPGPTGWTGELVLPYDEADVTFTFAALNYVLPQKNRYTYRLEDLDRDWSPVGPETSASYARIPPGEYVFRVRAANNDGVWNTGGVSLRLRVTPPFWQTGWFAAAAALAVAGVGALLHASRLRRMRQRFAAVLDERRRLSRELHDTLEQGLAGIALQVDSARQHLAQRKEAAERCLDTALRMVEYSREETRRTVNQLRSQALETGDIAQAVREVARELTSGREPHVSVEVRGVPRRLSAAAEHHLFRIAQEALTNAVTHARATRVDVSLVFAGDEVELTVSDDGRGLPEDLTGHGFHFGLSGMRERARALGSRLEVDSVPGAGTTIRVSWAGTSNQEGAPES